VVLFINIMLTGSEIKASGVVHDQRLYVGSKNGKVFCLNESSGSEMWQFDTGDDVSAKPAVGTISW
jgi:outer membrane protein assembly factor BamB